jgi:hypothetical protein
MLRLQGVWVLSEFSTFDIFLAVQVFGLVWITIENGTPRVVVQATVLLSQRYLFCHRSFGSVFVFPLRRSLGERSRDVFLLLLLLLLLHSPSLSWHSTTPILIQLASAHECANVQQSDLHCGTHHPFSTDSRSPLPVSFSPHLCLVILYQHPTLTPG